MSKLKEKTPQKKRRKKIDPSKRKQQPVVITERYTMIAEAAYYIAEHRGFAEGHEIDDWLQAEKKVDTL